MHFSIAVHAVVLSLDPPDLAKEQLVTGGLGRDPPLLWGAVAAGTNVLTFSRIVYPADAVALESIAVVVDKCDGVIAEDSGERRDLTSSCRYRQLSS